MPLLSAEFKTNMAVKYEEAKIYARNAYKKATTRTPKEPKETDDSPKKSMSMKEAYFKRMEKGTLRDDDTNPMDRMAAMRLVDAGLWDAKETEKLYAAYNKIRAKDGHRHKAKNAKTRYPTVADFYRFFRLVPVWKSTSPSGGQLFAKSFLGDDAAVLAPSSNENRHRHTIEQASRRWRGGRRDDSARSF